MMQERCATQPTVHILQIDLIGLMFVDIAYAIVNKHMLISFT